jgi:antitoxin (DNA-binding transcriptional repressor) of toxin-antitoxin stability system
MRKTTIRALKHDTTTIFNWVAAGESVEVTRRSKPVAILSPVKHKGKTARPDFVKRIRQIYGDKVLPTTATDLVGESRGES